MTVERTFAKKAGKQTVTRTATTETEAVQLQHYGYVEEKPARPAPAELRAPLDEKAAAPPPVTTTTEVHFDH